VIGLKHNVVCDTECYPNYWLAKFKSLHTGKYVNYEVRHGQPLDVIRLRNVLANFLVITFNGMHYDVPMMALALSGADNGQLKFASDWIILGNKKCWEFYEYFGLREPKWIDHIDLIEVAFGDGSLKLYGGRLHSKRLQDLPIDPDWFLTQEQIVTLDSYCANDLDTTEDLARHLKPQLELRMSMSDMYSTDLRSKSDAQIAEAVIKKEVGDVLGTKVGKVVVPAGTRFKYDPPEFITFQTEQMRLRLAEIAESSFVINDKGSPEEPKALDGMVVAFGAGRYRMGIGGLHSSEQCTAHHAGDGTVLMDADVTSFYPSIILRCGLFPAHLTEAFLHVYKSILDRRVKAKKNKDKVVDAVLKIVLNGSFGKFGNRYSTLYSPKLMLQVTITGQLALLMLIEALHLDEIECVSANTDGIVLKFHESRLDDVRWHIADWSERTGFAMEETFYKALYSRDVNNYLALKTEGGIKGKGDYAAISISKNPSNEIVNDAVKAFLEHGTPIEQTVTDCGDIRKFLTVQRVTGGAVKIIRTNYDDTLRIRQLRPLLVAAGWTEVKTQRWLAATWAPGEDVDTETAYRMECGEDEVEYIGKVVRFYIGRGVKTALHYSKKNNKGNRNKVPMSDGAVPCMELPDDLPNDIDHDFYINAARKVLREIGAA
jgi:hypothetical protein